MIRDPRPSVARRRRRSLPFSILRADAGAGKLRHSRRSRLPPGGRSPGEACALWGFRQTCLSRTLLGTASWVRGRPARIDSVAVLPSHLRAGRPRTQDAVPAQVAPWGEIRRKPLEPTPNRGRTRPPRGKKYLDPRSLSIISIRYEQRPGPAVGRRPATGTRAASCSAPGEPAREEQACATRLPHSPGAAVGGPFVMAPASRRPGRETAGRLSLSLAGGRLPPPARRTCYSHRSRHIRNHRPIGAAGNALQGGTT